MKKRIFLPQLLTTIMLTIAIHGDVPYAYYNLLRIVCFISYGYLAYHANENKNTSLVWIALIIAALYNPLVPVHLNREIWTFVNIATIVINIVLFFKLRRR